MHVSRDVDVRVSGVTESEPDGRTGVIFTREAKRKTQNTQLPITTNTSDKDTSLPLSLPYCPHCIPYADLER